MSLVPEVFVVSSSQAKLLASELANVLNESRTQDGNPVVHAECWARPDGPENNRQLLATLLERVRQVDFAVVILTGDDVLILKDRETEVRIPRDNCIFELGLFIGAFGKPERCFLLSSVEPKVLFDQLSDISGQLYRKLRPPKDFFNEAQCRVAALKNRDEILRVIEDLGRFKMRPRLPKLSIEDILERESDRNIVKQDDVVVIKEHKPPETRLHYAETVVENMNRPVNYLYLFGSRPQNYAKIVEMLRSLIAAEALDRKDYQTFDASDNEVKRAWLDDQERNRKTIEKLKKRLFIELVDDVEFDEFCIHSAGQAYGKGYLKLEDGYLELPTEGARLRYEHSPYKAKKLWPTKVIFEPNTLHPEQQQGITTQIREKFPVELHEALIKACFERENE